MQVHLLGSIPGTFWGGVFGSFFSLAGVALSNRAADKRLRTQLEHERELRAKERELTLRKEIYLAGMEALQAGATIITDLANLDIPQEQIGKSYSEKAAAVAKVTAFFRAISILSKREYWTHWNVRKKYKGSSQNEARFSRESATRQAAS
jgi:hypothetical protein